MVIYESRFAKVMRFAKIHAIQQKSCDIKKTSLRPYLDFLRPIKEFSIAVSLLGADQQGMSIVSNGRRPCLN